MNLGSWQVTCDRPRRGRRSHSVRPRLALGVACTVGALVALSVPAGADNVATGTVTLAVRSVTVANSTGGSTFSYDVCRTTSSLTPTAGLPLPDGFCNNSDDPVQVTNGLVPDQIQISATDFVPSDGTGAPWTLCENVGSAPGLPACTGSIAALNGSLQAIPATLGSDVPGLDEASLQVQGWAVGIDPSLDKALDTTTNQDAPTGASVTEDMTLEGPYTSSDSSPSFSNTVTWTALPAV